jgi:hypothetical protein
MDSPHHATAGLLPVQFVGVESCHADACVACRISKTGGQPIGLLPRDGGDGSRAAVVEHPGEVDPPRVIGGGVGDDAAGFRVLTHTRHCARRADLLKPSIVETFPAAVAVASCSDRTAGVRPRSGGLYRASELLARLTCIDRLARPRFARPVHDTRPPCGRAPVSPVMTGSPGLALLALSHLSHGCLTWGVTERSACSCGSGALGGVCLTCHACGTPSRRGRDTVCPSRGGGHYMPRVYTYILFKCDK